MATYSYPREWGDAIHTSLEAGSTYNVDHRGEPQPLAKSITSAFPERQFKVLCYGNSLDIVTEYPWSTEDLEILAGVIAAHKATPDWPPPSEEE